MICDPTFKFTNVVAKWPGSVHDARIWRESDICARFERGITLKYVWLRLCFLMFIENRKTKYKLIIIFLRVI